MCMFLSTLPYEDNFQWLSMTQKLAHNCRLRFLCIGCVVANTGSMDKSRGLQS